MEEIGKTVQVARERREQQFAQATMPELAKKENNQHREASDTQLPRRDKSEEKEMPINTLPYVVYCGKRKSKI